MAGLTSLPRKKNIKGQPHKLAYVTEAEGDLLKSMGGAGKPVKGTKGVPAYFDAGEGMDGYGGADSASGSGGASDTSTDMDVDATYDGKTDFDDDFGMGVDLGSAIGGAYGFAGTDEGQPTNMAGLVDQANREGFSLSDVAGLDAAEARDAINAAMSELGYNKAVDLGFVNLIDRAEDDFDLSVARGVEDKYGLERGQVSPATVGGFSYTGPNSTAAGLNEMGTSAKDLAISYFNAIQSLPSLTGIIGGLIGLDMPGTNLGQGLRSALGYNPTSELGKDIAGLVDSLGLPSMPGSLDEAALSGVQAAAEAATGLDLSASAMAEGFFDSAFGTEEESVDDVDSRDSGTGKGNDLGSPSTSVADISSQTGNPEESIDIDLGGDELIPQLTPTVQTASIAAPELTVTPFKRPEQKQASSTNIESILEQIYGRKTASELLNRNIA